MKKLWFRAFNRQEASKVLQTLVDGDVPHPSPDSKTQVLERKLGIAPPRVYAYLSRFRPEYGIVGVALPYQGVTDGEVSPFDSGGINSHHGPIRDWKDPDKVQALAAYTWPRASLDELLLKWPASEWDRYVDGERPNCDGPHIPFQRTPELGIWREAANSWLAWVWELRVPGRLPILPVVERWTCPTEWFEQMVLLCADNGLAHEMTQLAKTYVAGGVSELFESCRAIP